LFSKIGKWDAVVTCFFIDTAKNIVDYLETIYKILKKGGVWINAGKFFFSPSEIFMEETAG
jgi:carnosine N-methyltransferase